MSISTNSIKLQTLANNLNSNSSNNIQVAKGVALWSYSDSNITSSGFGYVDLDFIPDIVIFHFGGMDDGEVRYGVEQTHYINPGYFTSFGANVSEVFGLFYHVDGNVPLLGTLVAPAIDQNKGFYFSIWAISGDWEWTQQYGCTLPYTAIKFT